MDDLVVAPMNHSVLLEIDDRMDHTAALMMMLLHLHILVRVIRFCINTHTTLLNISHFIPGGAGGGDGGGSSRPISSPNELVELLWRDFQAMQTYIFRVIQDHTLTQDQLREVQGQLNCMERTLMDRLKISFTPTPPRDVPADDSETDDDLDD
ncbi:hypothetical protein Syun_025912 [Stephania yunnanensis]|uniref:Uncharacterized protein n=1 Tax=Stephania yunnanensis TaxID=152371 RepID=A0AAP0EXX5_9MAGN